MMAEARQIDLARADESGLLAAAQGRDPRAIRELIRRNNRRLFRTARAILRNDSEAEDVVQETYVRAFRHLSEFEGRSAFSTWLTRIAMNLSISRMRQRKAVVGLEVLETVTPGAEIIAFPGASPESPEAGAARAQTRALLEDVIDALPEMFRVTFVLREIEGLSVEETASQLGIPEGTVKTRVFRARKLLREAVEQRVSAGLADLFPFDGMRCTRLADRVLDRLGAG
jgi:RNA polymerase sigma-70 factor (ECF subfamily)